MPLYIRIYYMLSPCGVAPIKNTLKNSNSFKARPYGLFAIAIVFFFFSVTPLYFELGILKMNELFKFEIAKLMHQHSHNLLPPGISSVFTDLSTIHSRLTRSQTQKSLYLPKFSIQRCPRSIKFQGTKIWNSLSPKFKILSFRKFKSKFKNQLIATYHVIN